MQGPLLLISGSGRARGTALLDGECAFPVIEVAWREAREALQTVRPVAVLAENGAQYGPDFAALVQTAAESRPYLPVIALGDGSDADPDPLTALPLAAPAALLPDIAARRLRARLSSALRVRALHDTVLRRSGETRPFDAAWQSDPLDDAAIVLAGRGASYPALSLAAGSRVGVVGAFSIEVAAKHLNGRDLDGVILAEGFSPRVADAFLTVLAEDARFRNLPVIVAGELAGVAEDYGLPNFEIVTGEASRVVTMALPLIRQQAFAARLARALTSLAAGGLLDPRTGLMTPEAFARDLTQVVTDAARRGTSLTVARFAFDSSHERASFEAARILSRLMRRADFAARFADHAVVVAFGQTELRTAETIARRLSSVLKHTLTGADGRKRLTPAVTLASLRPGDTARALLDRLNAEPQRAAS
ncbi:MAG: GGDEF domain-containing protein [Xanthobacteraceae bacterium]|nr:MAG: GGDEF domain-containing protein [Xanthobacteraceae bacterium]